MEKEKPRLARLTAILTQLQSKRIVTARDIAEKLNGRVKNGEDVADRKCAGHG